MQHFGSFELALKTSFRVSLSGAGHWFGRDVDFGRLLVMNQVEIEDRTGSGPMSKVERGVRATVSARVWKKEGE